MRARKHGEICVERISVGEINQRVLDESAVFFTKFKIRKNIFWKHNKIGLVLECLGELFSIRGVFVGWSLRKKPVAEDDGEKEKGGNKHWSVEKKFLLLFELQK
mgnify:CR=1 FL=1